MFTEFLAWQTARTLRATGQPPAPSSLRTTGGRLRSAAKLAGVETSESFGTLLGDRVAVVSLLDKLYARHQGNTVRADLVVLRQFGEYAVAKGWAGTVAIEKADRPRSVPQRPIVVYTAHEVELLLAIARSRDLRYGMFLTTIAETGRRVSEILSLRWDWLNLDCERPYFDLPTSKTKRQAFVPLSKRLREDVFTPANIERLKVKGRSRQLLRPIDIYPFPYAYKTANGRLEVVCDIANVPNRGYHCFRHTKATELLARGVPIQAVSALLGHADVATTDRLYHHATTLDYASYLDA